MQVEMVCSERFEFIPFLADLRDVFITLHQQYSPQKRKLYHHLTCAIVSFPNHIWQKLVLEQLWQDTNATSTVITQGQHLRT